MLLRSYMLTGILHLIGLFHIVNGSSFPKVSLTYSCVRTKVFMSVQFYNLTDIIIHYFMQVVSYFPCWQSSLSIRADVTVRICFWWLGRGDQLNFNLAFKQLVMGTSKIGNVSHLRINRSRCRKHKELLHARLNI